MTSAPKHQRISAYVPISWYRQFDEMAKNLGQTKVKLLKSWIEQVDGLIAKPLKTNEPTKLFTFRLEYDDFLKLKRFHSQSSTALREIIRFGINDQNSADLSYVLLDSLWQDGNFQKYFEILLPAVEGCKNIPIELLFKFILCCIELFEFAYAEQAIILVEQQDPVLFQLLSYGLAVEKRQLQKAHYYRTNYQQLHQLASPYLDYYYYYSALESTLNDDLQIARSQLTKVNPQRADGNHLFLKLTFLQVELLICEESFKQASAALRKADSIVNDYKFPALISKVLNLKSIALYKSGKEKTAELLAIKSINAALIHGGRGQYIDRIERFLPYWLINYNQRLLFTYFGQLATNNSTLTNLYRELVFANQTGNYSSKSEYRYSQSEGSLHNLIANATAYLYGTKQEKQIATNTLAGLSKSAPYQLLRTASNDVLEENQFQFAI